MNKRVLSLFLVLLFAVGMLAGCAGNNGGQTTAATTKNAATTAGTTASGTTTAGPVSETRYTYVYGYRLSGAPDKDCAMELYWEDRLNIDLDIRYYETANYDELLNLDLAAGKIPDVFTGGSRTNLRKFVTEGVIGEFTQEYIQEKAPALYASIVNDMSTPELNAFDYCTIDGKLYALPALNPDATYPAPVVWNMDWLSKVGFDTTPESLEDFITALYAFRNDDPDGNGVKDTYGFSKEAMNMFYGAYGAMPGIWLSQSDGKVAFDIAQEGSKEALELLAKFYKDEVLDPEYVTGENKGGYWAISHSFGEGRIGLSGMGSFYHWTPSDAPDRGLQFIGTPALIHDNNTDLTYDFGKPPVGPDGKSGTNMPIPLTVAAVFSKALIADDARFAKYLSVIENTGGFLDPVDFITNSIGQEGKSWDYSDKGVPMRYEEYSSVAALTAMGGQLFLGVYSPNGKRALDNARYEWIDSDYARLGLVRDGYRNVLIDILPSAADYLTEATKVLTDGKTDIITGVQPIDYYDTVIKNFMKAGGETLTQEANELVK